MKKTNIVNFNGAKSVNASIYENGKYIQRLPKDNFMDMLSKIKTENEDVKMNAVRRINGKYVIILDDNENRIKIEGIDVNDEHFHTLYNMADVKTDHFKVIPTACVILTASVVLASPVIGPTVGKAYTQVKDAYVENERRYDDFERMSELSNKIMTIYGTSKEVYELEGLIDEYSKIDNLKDDQVEKLATYAKILNECGPKIIEFEHSQLTEQHQRQFN